MKTYTEAEAGALVAAVSLSVKDRCLREVEAVQNDKWWAAPYYIGVRHVRERLERLEAVTPADARAKLDEMLAAAKLEAAQELSAELASIYSALADRGAPVTTDERPIGTSVGEAVDALIENAQEAVARARAEGAAEEREACAAECVRNVPAARIKAWDASPRSAEVDQTSALVLRDRIRARAGRAAQ